MRIPLAIKRTQQHMHMYPQHSADVIVIGGGPAGSAVALQLARQQYSVILLERQHPASLHRDHLRSGEALIPRTIRELERLGVHLHNAPWARSPIQQIQIFWPNRTLTSDSISAKRHLIQIDRRSFEDCLRDAAVQAGVDLRYAMHARQLVRSANGSICGVLAQSAADQSMLLLRAPLVIDASGRQALSFREFQIRSLPAVDYIAIALFFNQVAGLLPSVWEMHLFDPAHLTVVQLSQFEPGLVRCGLGTRGELYQRSRQLPLDYFWSRIQQHPGLAERLTGSQVVARHYVRAPIGYQVRQVTFDGLLLVGDATGFLNPLLGDGILRALASARRAAAISIQALQHRDYTCKRLIAYEQQHQLRMLADTLARSLIQQAYAHPKLLEQVGSQPFVRQALFASLLRQ